MTNPKHNVKCLLVVAISFAIPRTFRAKTKLTGSPLRRTLHSQSVSKVKEIKYMVLEHIQRALLFSDDIPLDIIFVNNNTGDIEANIWLHGFNNMRLENGSVKVIDRENSGWSYGAYSFVVDKFINKYDYFIFTEDDVYVGRPNMLEKCIVYFNSFSDTGFLSFQGVSHSYLGTNKPDYYHARGGIGLTSNNVLKEVVATYGSTPYCRSGLRSDYVQIILEGEVGFTNVIYKLGYNLIELPRVWPFLVEYDFDHRRGIKINLYPNPIEILINKGTYWSRKFIFNIIVSSGQLNRYRSMKEKFKSYVNNIKYFC